MEMLGIVLWDFFMNEISVISNLSILIKGRPLHSTVRYMPFFIIGSGRSGNTLLRTILETHPEVHIPPETYVIGKVNKPGEFAINMDTSVMQILSKAGGLNPFASKGSIKILRQKENKIVKIPFDYGDVEKGKNLEQNIILQAGDVVVVP